MTIFLILVGLALYVIEPAFGVPVLLAAAMFAFWAWHDRSKQRQANVQVHQ